MRVPVIYNRTSIRLPSPSGTGSGTGSLLSSLYRWPYLAELLRNGLSGGSSATNANNSAFLHNLSASLANLSHSVLNNVSASALSNSFGSRSVSSLSRVASSTHSHHLPTSHHHSYGMKCLLLFLNINKIVLKILGEMPSHFEDVTWTLDKHKTDAHDAFFYIEAICNAWFSFEIATRFLVS